MCLQVDLLYTYLVFIEGGLETLKIKNDKQKKEKKKKWR